MNFGSEENGKITSKFKLEIPARNNLSPTLPIYLSRIQITLIIFQNCQKTNHLYFNWRRECNIRKTQHCATNINYSNGEIILYLNCSWSYLRLNFRFCFIKRKWSVRMAFNGFTNDEIYPVNSTAKQCMLVSRPCITCDREIFRVVFGSNVPLFFALKKDFSPDDRAKSL